MEEKRLLIALERDQKDSLEVDMLDLRETGAKVTPEGEFTLLTDEEFQEQESELWTEIKELEKLIAASEGKIKTVFVCFQSHKILNLILSYFEVV